VRLTRVISGVPLESGRVMELGSDAAHHVIKVLRLGVGDPLVVFDGQGNEFAAEIESCAQSRVRVRVLEPRPAVGESPLRITLVQAVSRTDRMDLTLQKATELGVHAIAPVLSARSIVKLDGEQARRKLEHWRAIVVNACEQCARSTLPILREPEQLASYLLRPRLSSRSIVLDPSGTGDLAAVPGGDGDLELLIGPEGGLEPGELELAGRCGFESRRLGPRILRTETAGVAAIAILQALHGDLAHRPASRE
jgi:16S rRNA (uracil1498-N3)-methyltransferase